MPKLNPVKLQRRVISATVLIPLTVLLLYLGGYWFLALIAICTLLCATEWASLARASEKPSLLTIAGFLYLSIAFYALYLIRTEGGLDLALLFVAMIWFSDIFAYFFGKFIGGPKMMPAISPNKTWAGLVGAIAGPLMACLIYITLPFDGLSPLAEAPFGIAIGFSMLVGVIAQIGDLLISSLKRYVGVKDTGQLIPGHGGLLDRLDAMILAGPIFLTAYHFYTVLM